MSPADWPLPVREFATRLSAICLDLPEATERETWESLTYRVRDKMFVVEGFDGERLSMSCKAEAGAQALLVAANAERFFVPRYVGRNGWIGVRLDEASDWDEVALLVLQSWRMTAPKRLAATL